MPAPDGASDVFLHVVGSGGALRGEATAEGHVDDIIVAAWRWGVAASSALGAGPKTARRSHRHLVVSKGIDSASVPLFASLVQNAKLREVVLTVRKAGGEALDYFRIALADARVVDLDVEVDAAGRPCERVTFSFRRIVATYTPQQSAGAGGGASEFEDEVLPAE